MTTAVPRKLAELDWQIPIGDTWRSPKRYVLIVAGAGIDLEEAGWVVRAQAKLRPGATQVLHEWSTELGVGGIELDTTTVTVNDVDIETSTIRFHVPASVTEDWDDWTGDVDAEIEHPTFDNGALYRKTFARGRIAAIRDVTRG